MDDQVRDPLDADEMDCLAHAGLGDVPRDSRCLWKLTLLLAAIGWLLPSTSLLAASVLRTGATASSVIVDANYPGGNIIVERIEGDAVYLRPDLRDTQGWWFYWSFRVREAQGRTLTFRFSGDDPIGVRGPAVSTDGGRNWSWLGLEAVQDASFKYTFSANAEEVRFCRV